MKTLKSAVKMFAKICAALLIYFTTCKYFEVLFRNVWDGFSSPLVFSEGDIFCFNTNIRAIINGRHNMFL